MGREGDEGTKERRDAQKRRGPLWPYLPLREVQVHGDLISPEPGQIIMVSKLGLQLPQLLLGEGCPLLAGLAATLRFPSVLLVVWGREDPKQEDVSCRALHSLSFVLTQQDSLSFSLLFLKDAEKGPMLSFYLSF